MCCYALEEAADALADRHEKYEEVQERQKWGDRWLITPSNLEQLRREDAAEMQLPALSFFKTEVWLRLSKRFFMNGAFDDGNWQSVGDDLPAIRATALGDFHSLAVSITKRLVSAALYFSMSRIRSKRALVPKTRNLVRTKDVEAAVASLGLQRNCRLFWAGSARRLKLQVYEKIPRLGDREDVCEPMSYEEVEKMLADRVDGYQPAFQNPDPDEVKRPNDDGDDDSGSDDDSIEDNGSDDNDSMLSSFEAESSIKREQGSEAGDPADTVEAETQSDVEARLEAAEMVHLSAMSLADASYDRSTLVANVKAERRYEGLADELDRQANLREEKRMWALLGRSPPGDLPSVTDLDGSIPRSVSRGVAEDVSPVSGGRRDKTRLESDWDTAPEARPAAEERRRRGDAEGEEENC